MVTDVWEIERLQFWKNNAAKDKQARQTTTTFCILYLIGTRRLKIE